MNSIKAFLVPKFSVAISLVSLMIASSTGIAGVKKVPLTPKRQDMCMRMLQADAIKTGNPLPAGVVITGATINAKYWKCTACGHRAEGISARFPEEVAECENCGKEMDPDEHYESTPAEDAQNLDLSPAQIDAFLELGENWACSYCKATGLRDSFKGKKATACAQCGAPRPGFGPAISQNSGSVPVSPRQSASSAAETAAEALPAPSVSSMEMSAPPEPAIVSTSASAGTLAPQSQTPRLRDVRSVNDLRQAVSANATAVQSHARRALESTSDWRLRLFAEGVARVRSPEDLRRVVIRDRQSAIIGAGLMLSAIGMPIFWLSTTSDTPFTGTISQARWIQTVRVEQFQSRIDRAPCDQITPSEPIMPVNGQGERPGARIIERNGTMCRFETFKWEAVDTEERRGTYDQPLQLQVDRSNPTSWGRFQTINYGRIFTQTRFDVDITFSANGENHTAELRPTTFEEFRRFRPGSPITVTLNPLRSVQNVRVGE